MCRSEARSHLLMAAPRARTTPILCTLELAMRTKDLAALAAAAWIHRYPAAVTTSAWLPVCEPPSFSHPASPTPQMPRLPGQLEGTTVTKKVVPRPQVVRKHHLWPFASTGEASAPVSRFSDTPCRQPAAGCTEPFFSCVFCTSCASAFSYTSACRQRSCQQT